MFARLHGPRFGRGRLEDKRECPEGIECGGPSRWLSLALPSAEGFSRRSRRDAESPGPDLALPRARAAAASATPSSAGIRLLGLDFELGGGRGPINLAKLNHAIPLLRGVFCSERMLLLLLGMLNEEGQRLYKVCGPVAAPSASRRPSFVFAASGAPAGVAFI